MKYLLNVFLLIHSFSYSQNGVINDRIIHLEEVVLKQKKLNAKLLKQKGSKMPLFLFLKNLNLFL